jgi:hypothetical protein
MNDMRGKQVQVMLSPEELAAVRTATGEAIPRRTSEISRIGKIRLLRNF